MSGLVSVPAWMHPQARRSKWTPKMVWLNDERIDALQPVLVSRSLVSHGPERCETCNGKGRLTWVIPYSRPPIRESTECPKCDGSGRPVSDAPYKTRGRG